MGLYLVFRFFQESFQDNFNFKQNKKCFKKTGRTMSFVALCALLVATGAKWEGLAGWPRPLSYTNLAPHQVDTERNVVAMF